MIYTPSGLSLTNKGNVNETYSPIFKYTYLFWMYVYVKRQEYTIIIIHVLHFILKTKRLNT